MIVQPVGADQVQVAGLHGGRERVDLDRLLGAERAGDHRPVRVLVGLLLRQPARADELGDERVVVGELLQPAVADAVGPRVADVADRDGAGLLVDERDGDRRPHPGGRGIVQRAAEDAVVGVLHERARRPPRPAGPRRAPRARPRRCREASSPACAPPMPSATANSGGSQTKASSLPSRRRPVSVSALARAILTLPPGGRSGRRGSRLRPAAAASSVTRAR